jgi:hypothetical protein
MWYRFSMRTGLSLWLIAWAMTAVAMVFWFVDPGGLTDGGAILTIWFFTPLAAIIGGTVGAFSWPLPWDLLTSEEGKLSFCEASTASEW